MNGVRLTNTCFFLHRYIACRPHLSKFISSLWFHAFLNVSKRWLNSKCSSEQSIYKTSKFSIQNMRTHFHHTIMNRFLICWQVIFEAIANRSSSSRLNLKNIQINCVGESDLLQISEENKPTFSC